MKILKKDGRIQEFELSKIQTSIDNSAKDSGDILNESDLNILVQDVFKNIKDLRGSEGETSSYEVIGTIFHILKRDGFGMILKSYLSFKK